MKRSEMIQTIIDALYKSSFCELEISSSEASDILDAIEKAGMVPPETDKIWGQPIMNVWEDVWESEHPEIYGVKK